ncbi:hypothetical protein [Duganella hordei]|uniref:hypothetical protein n=1 Tax=Duganella hordei TaxID=2865934 RepID=UPI0030E7DF1E
MPLAHTFLFKRSFEFLPRAEIASLPVLIRGIYVLYLEVPQKGSKSKMDVVYVGMARGDNSGAKGRLKSHIKTKADWTHCSVFEVWDNIYPQQIEELEGLFRHLYRQDSVANKLNKQKAYAPLVRLAKATKLKGS